MQSKRNKYIRPQNSVKEFRKLETRYRKTIVPILNKQVSLAVTKTLVNKAKEKWLSINKGALLYKAEPSIQLARVSELDQFLTDELESTPTFQDGSSQSGELTSEQKVLIVSAFLIALLLVKKQVGKLFDSTDNERLQALADEISYDVDLTNEAVLAYIANYVGELVKGINNTTREHIKVYIRDMIVSNRSLEDTVKGISRLYGINERRAWSIARTEISNVNNYARRLYIEKRGLKEWVWNCNTPEDWGCLINCGVIRRVGEKFPSGDYAPTVHPSCECYMTGHVPSDGLQLNLLVPVIESGIDWNGE